MKTRVCHFTSTHQEKDQRIFYKQCASLVKKGYEVYLVEQGESEESLGVHIIGTGEKETGRWYRLLVRPRKVYQLAKKIDADIYEFHDMELLPYGLKLKRRGKKVIFDYHEDYATRFSDSDALFGPRWLKKMVATLYCNYEKRAASRFDAMISVTPHIVDRLKSMNENTVMVTNYPLIDNENWMDASEYNAKSDYIAFAGQVSETYNLAHITKSIQDLHGIKFKFCGPVRKQEEYKEIMALDVNGHNEYLGNLPYMEVPRLLNQALAAIVLPGYSTNTGGNLGTLGVNKLFEGMLCGIPVICTDFKLWKQIIDDHKCGFYVSPYDEKAFVKCVQYIIDHPDEAKKMGANGRQAVLNEYNWKTQEQVLYSLYEKISS